MLDPARGVPVGTVAGLLDIGVHVPPPVLPGALQPGGRGPVGQPDPHLRERGGQRSRAGRHGAGRGDHVGEGPAGRRDPERLVGQGAVELIVQEGGHDDRVHRRIQPVPRGPGEPCRHQPGDVPAQEALLVDGVGHQAEAAAPVGTAPPGAVRVRADVRCEGKLEHGVLRHDPRLSRGRPGTAGRPRLREGSLPGVPLAQAARRRFGDKQPLPPEATCT
ncbi:hypothetical protein GCM10017687_85570 [Streptomyces echinatus]